jgi:hypothetical protein
MGAAAKMRAIDNRIREGIGEREVSGKGPRILSVVKNSHFKAPQAPGKARHGRASHAAMRERGVREEFGL